MTLDNLGQSGTPPPPQKKKKNRRYIHVILFIKYSDVHPSKEVTQHDSDRSYFFYPGFYIHQVRYPWKACLFAFRLMPYLFGLFSLGARAGWVNWGQCHKGKVAKIYRIVWENACSVKFWAFLLWVYARVPTAHSLRRTPPILSEDFGLARVPTAHSLRRNLPILSEDFRRSKWAVGTRAYTHKRKSPKLDIACISHSIG